MSDRDNVEIALAESLYLAFWQRNEWADKTHWGDQSEAIRRMWIGIAADAIDLLPPSVMIANARKAA